MSPNRLQLRREWSGARHCRLLIHTASATLLTKNCIQLDSAFYVVLFVRWSILLCFMTSASNSVRSGWIRSQLNCSNLWTHSCNVCIMYVCVNFFVATEWGLVNLMCWFTRTFLFCAQFKGINKLIYYFPSKGSLIIFDEPVCQVFLVTSWYVNGEALASQCGRIPLILTTTPPLCASKFPENSGRSAIMMRSFQCMCCLNGDEDTQQLKSYLLIRLLKKILWRQHNGSWSGWCAHVLCVTAAYKLGWNTLRFVSCGGYQICVYLLVWYWLIRVW